MSSQLPAHSSWIRQMIRINSARVPVGHTIRSAIGVGAPFIIGALSGHLMAGMWVGLAALLMAPGEREGSHRLNLRILLISTPIAVCGYLLGFVQDWSLMALVPLMALLAFIAGAIASYGAPLSVAGMQFLLIAAVALGVPGVDWWVAIGWYFVGGLFYLMMMLIEFALDRHRPERNATHSVLGALAALAQARATDLHAMASGTRPADTTETAAARAKALGAIQAARVVADTGHGRTLSPRQAAFSKLIGAAESVAALITGSQDTTLLDEAAARINQMLKAKPAGTVQQSNAPSAQADSGAAHGLLSDRLAALEQADAAMAIGLNTAAQPTQGTAHSTQKATTPVPSPRWNWQRLALGHDAMGAALRLALVYGVAVAARSYFPWAHWFWVPLTVCLVMKPDFGSVFDRAILRVLGTAIGILISTAVILVAQLPALQPHGALVIAIAITILAALVPWFMMRTYTLQAVAIAPIVVLLVAVIQPNSADTNYSMERIGATIVGGILVLVLGYALWPSARRTNVSARISSSLNSLGDYLLTSLEATGTNRHERLVTARRATYQSLANLRMQLQRALADAPPASTAAQNWLPAVAALERLVDGVDIIAERTPPAAAQSPEASAANGEYTQLLSNLRTANTPQQVQELATALRHNLLTAQS